MVPTGSDYKPRFTHKIDTEKRFIECTPADLDDARELCRELFGDYSHFTIRNGKMPYHMIHLPDRSCGIYYAIRITDDGYAVRRAMEPNTLIKVKSK